MSFKVGNRVVVTSDNMGDEYVGEVGVIVQVHPTYEYSYLVDIEGMSAGDEIWSNVELVKDKQAIDTSGKYVRAVYELVDLSIQGNEMTLDMGEIKELIKELQELV